MRSDIVFLAFAILVFGMGLPANARVVQTEKEVFYTVRGDTAARILADIIRKGPDGAVAYAKATYNVQIATRKTGSRCSIDGVTIQLQILYKYPRWKPHRRASACVRRTWTTLEKRIRAHERTHGDSYLAAARDADRAIQALEPHKSCRSLRRVAKREFNAIYKRMRRWNKDFDRRTQDDLLNGISTRRC